MFALLVLAGAVGLALGSFGNVLLYRLHEGKPLDGRSFCPSCKKPLRLLDLVPVFSFLFLRGRCRMCGVRISFQYPLVELLSCAAFVFGMAVHPVDPLAGFLTGFFLYFLLLASAYDALHQHIPDACTLGIAAVALLAVFLLGKDITSIVLGAGVGAAWFGLQWGVTRGRAVGSGDILLTAAIGLFLGFWQTVVMLVLSYMTGAAFILVLLSLKKITLKKGARIAFGPFLGCATVLALAGVGDAYLSLFH